MIPMAAGSSPLFIQHSPGNVNLPENNQINNNLRIFQQDNLSIFTNIVIIRVL